MPLNARAKQPINSIHSLSRQLCHRDLSSQHTALNEFELIARYFTPAHYSANVLLGVGDDAAVLAVPTGFKLVAAVDTIVAGVHFPLDSNPYDIGYRALAINLSDMAAMGAIPRWFTLSLCIPTNDESWLASFAAGLNELANEYQVQLVGGDTVKGPLNISVQIMGCVEADRWLTRAGAQPGDRIYVSGTPGEAAGGLQLQLHPELAVKHASNLSAQHLRQRFLRPIPRVALGRALRLHASAAMDVSDGLLTDLRKLCVASQCGARIQLEALPASTALHAMFEPARCEQLTLCGGDDYELLFTVSEQQWPAAALAIAATQVSCTQIGYIVKPHEVQCFRHADAVNIVDSGFDHFANQPR